MFNSLWPKRFEYSTEIWPFNLDSDRLKPMFLSDIPVGLGVVVALLYGDPNIKPSVENILSAIKRDINSWMPKLPVDSGTPVAITALKAPAPLWAMMDEIEEAWKVNDIYIQCGFLDLDMTNNPAYVPAIATAMTLYDMSYTLNQTLDPSTHQPLIVEREDGEEPIPAAAARHLRLIMGSAYREGAGVWCKDLIQIRNEILIKFRARIAGLDPVLEFARFVETGGEYFLEYPTL